MKFIQKYPFMIGITLVLLLLNVIPVLVLPERAGLSNYSLFPTVLMVLVMVNGLAACIDKHKGNYLMLGSRRGAGFTPHRSYTKSDRYEKEFRWMLLVPQTVFLVHDIYGSIQSAKELRQIQAQRERERVEQERREELGRWK